MEAEGRSSGGKMKGGGGPVTCRIGECSMFLPFPRRRVGKRGRETDCEMDGLEGWMDGLRDG